MKNILLAIFVISLPWIAFAQHTFSIVAVDSITGEIGSAGATCGDSIIWPGTPGAKIISDVIPGIGAIHTQSYHHATNQLNAHNRMVLGEKPEDIISWLTMNDAASNPSIRQYGIVDYHGGHPRSAAYTGANCFDYKNHILGRNYAIQGNILLGHQILSAMESGFNHTDGCLSDKLMAALQGAKVVGADSRCASEGTSSLSAFLRVAKPLDHPDTLFIDLNIAGTSDGVEPIDELQKKYDHWKQNHMHKCSPLTNTEEISVVSRDILVYPNPTDEILFIEIRNINVIEITVIDIFGKLVFSKKRIKPQQYDQISFSHLESGVYFINFLTDNAVFMHKTIVLLD